MPKPEMASLDAQSLRLLVAIYDSGSVTAAAGQLGISQSTASHGLDKLRQAFSDPLFVKVGRGIAPTDRVEQLVPKVRTLLSDFTRLLEVEEFDPSHQEKPLVIATNAYGRQELTRKIFGRHATEPRPISLELIELGPSRNIEAVLGNNAADLVIAIAKSDCADFVKSESLRQDRLACFYDPQSRDAPNSLEKYCEAPHAVVDFGGRDDSLIDISLKHRRISRSIKLRVSTIECLPRLISGTKLVTTMPASFAQTIFAGLAHCEPPIEIPAYSVDQYWHVRSENSPRNEWLRHFVKSAFD